MVVSSMSFACSLRGWIRGAISVVGMVMWVCLLCCRPRAGLVGDAIRVTLLLPRRSQFAGRYLHSR